MTPNIFGPIISTTAGDTDLATMKQASVGNDYLGVKMGTYS